MTFLRSLLALCLVLTAAGCATRPWTTGPAIDHRLVEVLTPATGIKLDIRYATTNNFTKRQLYPFPAAYLHADAYRALVRVNQQLQARGLALKIYDGYRPLSVQQRMWDLIRDERYVSNPAANRGRHTRGTAVDVTLVDQDGDELPMPSGFDDFSERAHRDYAGGTEEQRKNRALLERVMAANGFIPYPYEWWHFDLNNWEAYPVLDISFDEIEAGKKTTPSIQ